jgi:hypothetical protein
MVIEYFTFLLYFVQKMSCMCCEWHYVVSAMFFSEIQISEHQIFDPSVYRILNKINNFELSNFRTTINSNSHISKLSNFLTKKHPIGLLFLVTILPLGAYLG